MEAVDQSLMLVCGRCSMRVRSLKRSDVPERGIVCGRCGHRLLPATLQVDRGRRGVELPACELRGDQLSTVDCRCQGKVRVFGCAHGDNAEGLALSYRPSVLKGLPENSLPSCKQCPFQRLPAPAAEPTVSPETPLYQPAAKPPGLLQMAGSALLAGIRFAASGKLLDRPARDARLAVCRKCPALNGPQCTECGCLVAVKTWLPAEECPQKLWPIPAACSRPAAIKAKQ